MSLPQLWWRRATLTHKFLCDELLCRTCRPVLCLMYRKRACRQATCMHRFCVMWSTESRIALRTCSMKVFVETHLSGYWPVTHSFNNQRLQKCSQHRSDATALLRFCEENVSTCSFDVVPRRAQLEVAHTPGRNAAACCLIRNKITADPDGLFGTGQRPQVVMPMDHRLLSMLTDTHTCRTQCPPGLPIWCSQALFPFTHWHHVRCLCISTNSSD